MTDAINLEKSKLLLFLATAYLYVLKNEYDNAIGMMDGFFVLFISFFSMLHKYVQ